MDERDKDKGQQEGSNTVVRFEEEIGNHFLAALPEPIRKAVVRLVHAHLWKWMRAFFAKMWTSLRKPTPRKVGAFLFVLVVSALGWALLNRDKVDHKWREIANVP